MYSPEDFKKYVEVLHSKVRVESSDPTNTTEIQYLVAGLLFEVHYKSPSPQHLDEAIRQLTYAAKQGHAGAQFGLGRIFHEQASVKNESSAKQWLTSAANKGEGDAQYMLGQILIEEGGAENEIAAIKWFERATKQNNQAGTIALKLRAIQHGHKEAQYILGQLYLEGKGVDKNLQLAAKVLDLAAKQGHKEAEICLNLLFENELKQEHELQRNIEALYSKFPKETQDLHKVFRATFPGDAEAEIQYKMGLYWREKGDLSRHAESVELFALAAKDNHAEAQYVLGIMYSRGEGGLSLDQQKAAELLGLSAKQGYEKAKNALERLSPIHTGHDMAKFQTTASTSKYVPINKNETVMSNISQDKSATLAHRSETGSDTQIQGNIVKIANKKGGGKNKPEARPGKSSTQGIALTKKIQPKILFFNALQTKTAELIKVRSKVDETRKLQEKILQHIKESADRLVQPLEGPVANKARLLGLDANLRDLKEIEKNIDSIKEQEKIINSFLDLLRGLQGELTAEENSKLQKRLMFADNNDKAESIPIFTIEKFLALRKALAENESINDEVFESGLIILKEKWDLVFAPADKIVLTCAGNLRNLSIVTQERVKKHSAFVACEIESEAFLAKVSAIKDTAKQIQLKVAQLSATTEEKTVQDRVEQYSQQTSALQGLGNESGTPARRVVPETRGENPPPAGREHREENALLVPKKLSKKERIAVREQQAAAKAARIVAHKLRQAAKQAQASKETQASARACKLEDIFSGKEVFSVLARETKVAQEEKTTAEKPNPLFKEKTMGIYNEVQKLKSIIKIITETEAWTSERIYAILQSFAFVNDVVSTQHEHPLIRAVAKCFRHAIFKQYKKVMNIVQNAGNLLDMVNAWITFLETENEIYCFAKEQVVLNQVSSPLLSKIHTLWYTSWSLKECDVEKSCDVFEEMMRFARDQRYERDCSIRLVLGEIGSFESLIETKHEIIIVRNQDVFTIFYKNKNSCATAWFECNDEQRNLLLNSDFTTGKKLVRDRNTEEIYKKVYAAVSLKEGCVRSGDDIIGHEAARFYWAITGSERGALEQAATGGSGRSLALLKQFAPQLFRPEHLERGIQARHFDVLKEETKNGNECVGTKSTELLFARNRPPLVSPCLSYVANRHTANLPNRQPFPRLSPVAPLVAFVFPADTGAPKVNSQSLSQTPHSGHNSDQQVKSASPKNDGF
ncbi:MAG TPA: tetratricopeptide repeat protein [Gammaproteobacteria bacterium]|nr:tetratricopeptide repeat protein [Gammaproteobacteria bacterium]